MRSTYKTILKLFNVKEHNAYKSNTPEAYKILANVNSMHSRFKEFIKKLHGVATRRSDNYLAWFSWIENYNRNENKNEILMNSLMNNSYSTTIRDIKIPHIYIWSIGVITNMV